MVNFIQQADSDIKKILEHLKSEYSHLQIGRASASLVEGLMVDAYGTRQALKAMSHVSVPDAKTIQIQPWDRGLLQAIEKAIMTSDMNLTPNNDGVVVRINIPALTEERRRDLTKVVHKLAEDARISVRHARQGIMDGIKAVEKNKEVSEDEAKGFEKKLQEKVDAANKDIETMAKNKEHDVLTV
jgi:ribosome recycling factor